MYYIYKIENLQNHRTYIGLTNNVARRRNRHFSDLRCGKHDNSFLQKDYLKFGAENFSFEVIFEGDVTSEEISEKEKYYIKEYDSYLNGYNQNEGGNFGPTNGGSHLTKTDIFSICAALEFCPRPGAVLAEMFEVTTTTISRIKHKVNHNIIIEEYDRLSLEERQEIYKIFCESSGFYAKKVKQTVHPKKRKLTKENVFMILYNKEFNIMPKAVLASKFGVHTRVFDFIVAGETYRDYKLDYDNLNDNEKQKIVSLFSNK